MFKDIKNVLNKTKYVSLTIDTWTDRRFQSFMGVTCNFFDANFHFKNIVLECKQVKMKHTASNLKIELEIRFESVDVHTLNIKN
ncbi:zinc finger BED domain-containing 1-like [Brachionus plicatilis]|uniref:Zinc finger BED domain-containing 1-like n=1 Tax=Brachionus plicatilis TaxID=10195 RepID=A0A3M7S7G8_BRAPC|nr:zinc finger BED domain-containing 1-like [Brachionus plicatilis]